MWSRVGYNRLYLLEVSVRLLVVLQDDLRDPNGLVNPVLPLKDLNSFLLLLGLSVVHLHGLGPL